MTTWTNKAGEEVELKDVSIEYLQNIKNFLEKKEAVGSSMYAAVKLEFFVRQHAGSHPFLRELVDLLLDFIQPVDRMITYEDEVRNELNGLGQEW